MSTCGQRKKKTQNNTDCLHIFGFRKLSSQYTSKPELLLKESTHMLL